MISLDSGPISLIFPPKMNLLSKLKSFFKPKHPSTIEECHNFLLERLTNKDLESIKNCHKSSLCQYHHTMGRWMRNHWGLWSGGKLKRHMESLGFTHPDDMSTVILESFWSSLNGQPYDLKQAAESYKEYWRAAQNHWKLSHEKTLYVFWGQRRWNANPRNSWAKRTILSLWMDDPWLQNGR